MQTLREIRQIHHITSNTVTISVPEAFQNHRVEIIVLPFNEIAPQTKPKKKTDWRDKLAQATQIRTQIAARYHKQPLISAVDIIRQTREERNEYFDNMR